MIHFHPIHFQVDSLVLHYIVFWKPLAYVILFFAMIVEGETFLFTAAFLAAQGFLDKELTFFFLFAGVQLGDSLWYWLGHKINHSDNRFSRWLVKVTGPFDEHLEQNTLRTLFISKFIYGFHHFILARAGVLKIKFDEFVKYDLLSNLAWIVIVGGLGYLSGASFLLMKHYLKFAEYALILGLAIFLTLDLLIVKFGLRKKI